MTYHHLTIDELTMIANFRDQGVKAYRAAKLLHRSLETVYRVYRFLAAGHTLQEYYQHYRENKAHCGRKAIQLPTDEVTYIKAKVEVILNVHSKTATSVTQHLQEWLAKFPPHFFKSITFDNGKEFADWRAIANQFDLQTYFAEVGAPNQRGLNENNNGLLRRDGLHKGRDLRHLADGEVAQIMSYRNNIPRKSLGYQTPYEVFMKYVTDEQLLFF